MSGSWFYTRGGKDFGPLTLSGLKALAESGKLGPADSVWQEHKFSWLPASLVNGLFPESAADGRAPLPGEADRSATLPSLPPVGPEVPTVTATASRPGPAADILNVLDDKAPPLPEVRSLLESGAQDGQDSRLVAALRRRRARLYGGPSGPVGPLLITALVIALLVVAVMEFGDSALDTLKRVRISVKGADEADASPTGKVLTTEPLRGFWQPPKDPLVDATKRAWDSLPPSFKKDWKAMEAYKGNRGNFALFLVSGVWRMLEKPAGDEAEVRFTHKDGEIAAAVFASIDTNSLDDLSREVLEAMQKTDTGAAIVEKQRRVVNGRDVLAMALNANSGGVAFTYYSYFYSGPGGTVRVITFTGQKLFKELRPEMESFLNGLVIIQK